MVKVSSYPKHPLRIVENWDANRIHERVSLCTLQAESGCNIPAEKSEKILQIRSNWEWLQTDLRGCGGESGENWIAVVHAEEFWNKDFEVKRFSDRPMDTWVLIEGVVTHLVLTRNRCS